MGKIIKNGIRIGGYKNDIITTKIYYNDGYIYNELKINIGYVFPEYKEILKNGQEFVVIDNIVAQNGKSVTILFENEMEGK